MHDASGSIHDGPFFMPALCDSNLTDNKLRWGCLYLFSLTQMRVTMNSVSLMGARTLS